MKRIVIVGGGAGGIELATKLGNKLGKSGQCQITLVDKNSTHLWKPMLHEIASGALNDHLEGINYLELAQKNHFSFIQSELRAINRQDKTLTMINSYSESNKTTLLNYDLLVISVGSTSNDFGISGVKEHCVFLDDQNAAIALKSKLSSLFYQVNKPTKNTDINIAIVGAGATGVELAAELPNMVKQLNNNLLIENQLHISVIEAGNRILSALPEKVASNVLNTLTDLNINVMTNTKIIKVDEKGVYTSTGEIIKADMIVWSAGVKGPDFLKQIEGMDIAKTNQLIIKSTLQSVQDDNIFVIGDCAYYQQQDGNVVPPTAQAANQMAKICALNIERSLKGLSLKHFTYHNKGTIIALADTAYGVIYMTRKIRIIVAGKIALLMHHILYRMHQITVLGVVDTIKMIKKNKQLNKDSFLLKTK